jgi:hypothetical protein
MKKSKKELVKNLTQKELNVVYEILNNVIVEFESLSWNYNFVCSLLEGVDEVVSSTKNKNLIIKKIILMDDFQLLNLIIDSEKFWKTEEEIEYKTLNKKTPKEKLMEILKPKIPIKTPYKRDVYTMGELQFLMISQTIGNDFIVYEVNSNENLIESKWSVNKTNFHELLEELALTNTRFKIKSLEKFKEEIFI